MTNDSALVLAGSAARRELRKAAREVIREELRELIQGLNLAAANDGELMTNDDVMAYTGLSRPTLARYRKSGRLPYHRRGARVYYRRTDVDAFFLGKDR